MSDKNTICLKRNTCQLRVMIGRGFTGGSIRSSLPSIVDCPAPADFRCDEINSLATTGFDEARHIVRMGLPV